MTMLKRRSLVLRPADSPRFPAGSRSLCHPAFPSPVARCRKGSGYQVSESLPELIPFNQQVHSVLSDAPLCASPAAAWLPSTDFNKKETGCSTALTLRFRDHPVLQSESYFRIVLGLENAVGHDHPGETHTASQG